MSKQLKSILKWENPPFFYEISGLGAFTAVHHAKDIFAEYWAWILPHGITEMGAIVLCGGVGLHLGWAVVRPGLRTRGESLRVAGKTAVPIVVGVAIMLVFAAIIESFLRQSHLSTQARLLFAGGTLIFWTTYIWHGFRLNKIEMERLMRKKVFS